MERALISLEILGLEAALAGALAAVVAGRVAPTPVFLGDAGAAVAALLLRPGRSGRPRRPLGLASPGALAILHLAHAGAWLVATGSALACAMTA